MLEEIAFTLSDPFFMDERTELDYSTTVSNFYSIHGLNRSANKEYRQKNIFKITQQFFYSL